MFIGILAPIAVVAVIAVAVVLFLQRGAAGLDTSPRGLLRLYLYLGSLVSILVLVFGLSATLTGVIGSISPDFAFGTPPAARPALPPGAPPEAVARFGERPSPQEQNERRTRESLLQGITSAVAGLLFWAVHRYGRRQLETADERVSLIRRGYYLSGVVIFGIASIILLPVAIYNVLRYFLIPVGQFDFRPGAGDPLAGALAVVPAWLIYLSIVLRELRATRAAPIS